LFILFLLVVNFMWRSNKAPGNDNSTYYVSVFCFGSVLLQYSYSSYYSGNFDLQLNSYNSNPQGKLKIGFLNILTCW